MNMKKLLLSFLVTLLFCTEVAAMDLVPLTICMSERKDQPIGNGYPKSPMQPPTVYIEDYTLLFAVDHPEYVLNIKDEDDNVVYTTVVYSSLTQVILPSTLSGDYQIELVMGNWLFTGWINL